MKKKRLSSYPFGLWRKWLSCGCRVPAGLGTRLNLPSNMFLSFLLRSKIALEPWTDMPRWPRVKRRY